jgi:hypothetical protein
MDNTIHVDIKGITYGNTYLMSLGIGPYTARMGKRKLRTHLRPDCLPFALLVPVCPGSFFALVLVDFGFTPFL